MYKICLSGSWSFRSLQNKVSHTLFEVTTMFVHQHNKVRTRTGCVCVFVGQSEMVKHSSHTQRSCCLRAEHSFHVHTPHQEKPQQSKTFHDCFFFSYFTHLVLCKDLQVLVFPHFKLTVSLIFPLFPLVLCFRRLTYALFSSFQHFI